jgi:hypothetical protein
VLKVSRVALLTIPGWSNVQSWLNVVTTVNTLEFKVDLVSPNYWTLAMLNKRDAIGAKLETARVKFILFHESGLLFSTTSFSRAVILSRVLLILRKLGFSSNRNGLFKLVYVPFLRRMVDVEVAPAKSSDFANRWPVFLTDINSICTLENTSDLKFALLLRDSQMMSLFHGTYDLENTDFPNHEILKLFRNDKLTVFATKPNQVEKYKTDYGVPESSIFQVTPPRQEALRDSVPSKKHERSAWVVFFTRPTKEFKDFGWLQSAQAFGAVIHAISLCGGGTLELKNHPAENRIGLRMRAWLGMLIARKLNVSIQFGAKAPGDYKDVDLALTWFTGVTVDLAILGVPTYELRGDFDPKLGPSSNQAPEFDRLFQEGFCERITSFEDLVSALGSARKASAGFLKEPKRQLSSRFFSVPFSTDLVGEKISNLLQISDEA